MSIDHRYTLLPVIACVLALAAGCTRHVSRDISPQGKAGEVIFPSTDRIVLKEGTFPNVDSLRTVGAGITKDQLYELLGRPHFREGYYGVREWDYLFHFRMPGNGILTCQYKVIFDAEYRGQSFHWAPASCADLLDKDTVAVAAKPQELRFELSGDALFAFDRHAPADILPGGREQVAEIAAKLKEAKATTVQVIGHTDLLGSEVYNQGLSQQRALTIRQLLIGGGVPASAVTAIGAGESQPVKQCDGGLSHGALVACLQPNRRVEIIASGIE
ncbi:OmpA family protein [Pseudoxanthomonas putridarboris]|uniref:OmpA family protein n=1 Tax=Pseudoxanthomonas putridarboris TaxID=752605 RepID=A0ABU9J3T0_9GAMM